MPPTWKHWGPHSDHVIQHKTTRWYTEGYWSCTQVTQPISSRCVDRQSDLTGIKPPPSWRDIHIRLIAWDPEKQDTLGCGWSDCCFVETDLQVEDLQTCTQEAAVTPRHTNERKLACCCNDPWLPASYCMTQDCRLNLGNETRKRRGRWKEIAWWLGPSSHGSTFACSNQIIWNKSWSGVLIDRSNCAGFPLLAQDSPPPLTIPEILTSSRHFREVFSFISGSPPLDQIWEVLRIKTGISQKSNKVVASTKQESYSWKARGF